MEPSIWIIYDIACSQQQSDKFINMFTDRDVAAEAIDLVTDAKDTLLKSMELVESKCGPQEYAAYKRAVGRVVCTMLDEIVAPLYAANPSIKPEGWNG